MLRNLWKRCCRPRLGPTTFLCSASPFHSATFTLARRYFVSNEVEKDPGWRWRLEEEPSGFVDKEEEEQESALQISHPWPEWLQLMKCLHDKGHFSHEERNINAAMGAKDCNVVRTACLNFGRDHFHILRFLSRKDIGVTVALGCPSLDRKVINSGKRLRAYIGIDEGNVCSSCNLRGDCERAFVKAREDEGGRTVDIMRIVLTYGLDPINGSVENKPCLTKRVEESVRRLLKEIVEHSNKEKNSNFPDSTEVVTGHVHPNEQDKGKIDVSKMKQGDWLCPKCNFMNFARNIRCLRCDSFFEERIKQLKEDNNHMPLKKGDWICNKCNFLNFAKNTRCLQCKERPSNRQINPGEWECDSCNYVNFRRNMVCLKCDHRRPIMSKASSFSFEPQPEDLDHYKNSKFSFVARQGDRIDETPMVFERKNRNRDSPKWRFVEDRNENNKCLNKSNDSSEFIDFPIVGGKTHLTKVQRREAYKTELPNQCRRPSWQSETENEFCSSDNLSTDDEFCSVNNQSTDDEEMDEWFGKR
ncbi:Zinc finger protein VAR3, chloroplastic [Glycine max]|nr:Zinc finger protein VAR3, chloroplastic [Glycine max]